MRRRWQNLGFTSVEIEQHGHTLTRISASADGYDEESTQDLAERPSTRPTAVNMLAGVQSQAEWYQSLAWEPYGQGGNLLRKMNIRSFSARDYSIITLALTTLTERITCVQEGRGGEKSRASSDARNTDGRLQTSPRLKTSEEASF